MKTQEKPKYLRIHKGVVKPTVTAILQCLCESVRRYLTIDDISKVTEIERGSVGYWVHNLIQDGILVECPIVRGHRSGKAYHLKSYSIRQDLIVDIAQGSSITIPISLKKFYAKPFKPDDNVHCRWFNMNEKDDEFQQYSKEFGERNPIVRQAFCMKQSKGLRGDAFLEGVNSCLTKYLKNGTSTQDDKTPDKWMEPWPSTDRLPEIRHCEADHNRRKNLPDWRGLRQVNKNMPRQRRPSHHRWRQTRIRPNTT